MHTNINDVSTDLFQLAESVPFHDVHFWHDPKSQLKAIIAIDNTKLGPALGGCRFVPYENGNQALQDALLLAHGMSLKAAINHLDLGGGKAVILKPDNVNSREALFESFGEFVESLNGRYITAMDSGTGIDDMNVIARKTQHVVCTTETDNASGNPAPFTAMGVYHGIKAAVKFQLDKDSLEGVHIALQGIGHVGYQLAKLVHADGARLTVSDVNETAIRSAVNEFSAKTASPKDIYRTPCDVFAPCALGQTINHHSIDQLKTTIIAGSANNQLMSDDLGEILIERGILYAPDYVINSGGLLQIAYYDDLPKLDQKLAAIYDTLLRIFAASNEKRTPTVTIANEMAEAVLAA